MSAETVINKIEEKARAEADLIIKEGKNKAALQEEKILSSARAKADELISTAEKNAEILTRGAKQSAELQAKIELLDKKREELEKTKLEAKKTLLALDSTKWCEIFKKQIESCQVENEVTVVPSADSRSRSEALVKMLNLDGKAHFTLSDKDAEFEGGVLLVCPTYDIEISMDAILDGIFDKEEKRIADTLFAGENK